MRSQQTRLLAADDSDGPQGAVPKEAEQKWKAALEAANAHAADAQQKAGLGKLDAAQLQMEKAQQEMERAHVMWEKQGPGWAQIAFPQALRGDAGKYWIGVECREASPELRAQLGLKDNEGLVVLHVAEAARPPRRD